MTILIFLMWHMILKCIFNRIPVLLQRWIMLGLDFKGWFIFSKKMFFIERTFNYTLKNTLVSVIKQMILAVDRTREHFKKHNL